MTFGRRAAVLLAAFVTAVLLAACGGGGDGDGATSSVAGDAGDEMRLTLTEDGCTYEGPEPQATGSFTAEVENESSTYGAFEIGEIAEGSTLACFNDDVPTWRGYVAAQLVVTG